MVKRWTIGIVGLILALGAGVAAYFLFVHDPFEMDNYQSMCTSPRGFPEAAPLSASGPHPVYIDYANRQTTLDDLGPWRPVHTAEVQLIACVDEQGRGSHVERCVFQDTDSSDGIAPNQTIDLYEGHYETTIYEAGSGELVDRKEFVGLEFEGSGGPDGSYCKGVEMTFETEATQTDEVGSIDPASFREFLAPHVDE